MIVYILKFSACLAVFMLFYKLLLEKESFHKFKRFYLLGTLLLAAITPLITFTTYVDVAPLEIPVYNSEIATPSYGSELMLEEPVNYWSKILWSIYGIGVLIFAIRFGMNLRNIFKRIKHNPKFKNQSIFHVLLNDFIQPHTFLNYIFFNKSKYEAHEIPKEVILHEETHAKEKHALDILFIEVLQILFWFNPLLYFIKKDIKLNHEFLADKAVINNGFELKNYQNTLLAFSSHALEPQLANAINYSSIKKRFTVMKTHTSKSAIWFRSLILLPLLAILVYSFSTNNIIEKEARKKENSSIINSSAKKELVIMVQINSVSINAKTSSIESFKEDLNKATKNWEETDFISVIPILKIASCTENYLNNLDSEFRKTNFFLKTNQEIGIAKPNQIQTEILPKIYGRICETCEFSLTKEDIENLKIETNTNETISSFKIKFVGKPTINVSGNTLNPQAIALLKSSKSGDFIQLFDLKTPNTRIKPPVLIKLIAKSELPPPPPPPIPPNTKPDQKEKYKKVSEEYYKKNKVENGKVIKRVPPPPPPVPANATKEQKEKYQKISEEYYKKYKVENGKVSEREPLPPAPPKSEIVELPPPPPPPKSPLDHVIDMSKKGASFYFEGKQISSDKAIDILKTNTNMNISTKNSNSKNPKVYLSKEPITIKNK